VNRATGETESMQENIQDWFELDEGDPGLQLLTNEEFAAVIFFYEFSSTLPTLLYFPFICFLNFFFLLLAIFYYIKPDYYLIWMTSSN
jgi:hypothetical protein